jgi:hypothetical protein
MSAALRCDSHTNGFATWMRPQKRRESSAASLNVFVNTELTADLLFVEAGALFSEPIEETSDMRRFAYVAVALSLLSTGTMGCTKDQSSTKTETVTTTPTGQTTVTTEKDVKQTGDNPPPARP